MRQRWGLRAKMTASYLLVTAAAVLVVEIVAIVVVQPLLAPGADPSRPVQLTAESYAATVIDANARLGRLPTATEIQLGDPALSLAPGQALLADDKISARIPLATTAQDEARPMSLALLLDADLRIVATSYATRYPVGARVGGPGTGVLPVSTIVDSAQIGGRTGGQTKVSNGTVLWATAPVLNVAQGLDAKGPAAEDSKDTAIEALGLVYVQVPATAGFTGPGALGRRGFWPTARDTVPARAPISVLLGSCSRSRPTPGATPAPTPSTPGPPASSPSWPVACSPARTSSRTTSARSAASPPTPARRVPTAASRAPPRCSRWRR